MYHLIDLGPRLVHCPTPRPMMDEGLIRGLCTSLGPDELEVLMELDGLMCQKLALVMINPLAQSAMDRC